MKIDAVRVINEPPIHTFEVDGLSSVVVVAGPNGVGKTRLMNSIISQLRTPRPGAASCLVVSATSDEERNAWGVDALDTSNPHHARKLTATLQRRQKRGNWRSSALHFDSSRQFSRIQQLQWDWNFQDPAAEELGWEFTLNPFQQRFQDTIHAIYRMLGHHRTEISKRAIELRRQGLQTMPLDFPDPLDRFREVFRLLLGPKELADIDITNPQIRYTDGNTTLGIDSLSSGEREAFNIAFDLLLRKPEDCIIFFDEPELHLHPELSFRLLKTLQVIGARNQFVFLTHSPEIISGAIDNSVVFVTRKPAGENQALNLRATDDSVTALRELGQGLGVISLGRKIVLIEGASGSVDRDTYGAIVQESFPGLVLAPSGSRQTILSFARVVEDVLDRTLWGIEFYMLADRDNSLPEATLGALEQRSGGRLKFLPRLHVENYFLDEVTLANAFGALVGPTDWRRDPGAIRAVLIELAREVIPVAVNLWLGARLRSLVGEIDVSLKGPAHTSPDELSAAFELRLRQEEERMASYLNASTVHSEVHARWRHLEGALESDNWKDIFPGKILLNQFASRAGLKVGFLRSAYIVAARRAEHRPFDDILRIFSAWT